MKWTDVWKTPFHYDGYGYIYDKDYTMTFSLDMHVDSEHPFIEKFINDMVTVLNGGELTEGRYSDLTIEDGCDLYYGDKMIGSFRGWGHLTGSGSSALHLSEEKAASIQDELINYVMGKMSTGFKKVTHQELEDLRIPVYDKMIE